MDHFLLWKMDMLIISTSCDHDYYCYAKNKKLMMAFIIYDLKTMTITRYGEKKMRTQLTLIKGFFLCLLSCCGHLGMSRFHFIIVWLHLCSRLQPRYIYFFFVILLLRPNKLSQQKKMKGFSFRFLFIRWTKKILNSSYSVPAISNYFFCIYGESCSFSSYHHHFNNN